MATYYIIFDTSRKFGDGKYFHKFNYRGKPVFSKVDSAKTFKKYPSQSRDKLNAFYGIPAEKYSTRFKILVAEIDGSKVIKTYSSGDSI